MNIAIATVFIACSLAAFGSFASELFVVEYAERMMYVVIGLISV